MQFLVPQNALSMHVCKFSQGSACDVGSKYTLEVRVNNLGNEAALIVYGCIFFSVNRMSCARERL